MTVIACVYSIACFADDAVPAGVAWTGIGLAAIAAVTAAVNTISARKAARDKLEFDAKTVVLEEKVANQALHIANCDKAHERCEERTAAVEEKLERCEEQHKSATLRLDELERKVK